MKRNESDNKFVLSHTTSGCRKEGISVAVEEYGAEGIAELEQKSWGVLAEP